MMDKVTVIFEPEGGQVTVSFGTTILQAANQAGVRIRSECGGEGKCGKCRVIIKNQEYINKLTESEAILLNSEEVQKGFRLACCSKIAQNSGKLTVLVPKESRISERKFQEKGVERHVPLSPIISKYLISLQEPTLSDVRPDAERILECLRREHCLELNIDFEVLKNLPRILRDSNWNMTAVVWNNQEIISIEAGNTLKNVLGLAIDLGTSKIVTQLVELSTGKTLATASVENPQLMYGEDILSRITFSKRNEENLMLLQKLAVQGINDTIDKLCFDTNLDISNVYGAIVVGNTAMHHLFLGIRPEYLAVSPFTPAISKSVCVKSEELNIRMYPRGIVNFLPVIAGFVGADAVADLIACGICDMEDTSLLIDIGTNTEVFVSSAKDTLSCSCASGPAFEGAHISHGMKAVSGAIEKVRIDEDMYEVEYDTIHDKKPIGLCGSAIVDAVAEMLRCGIIDPSGRFNHGIDTPRLKKFENNLEFIVAWPDETGIGREISISEKDISEIQLAKAAIYAGCSILMKRKKVDRTEIDRILIAGAFGTNINPESAKLIGLIPDVPSTRIDFVGNTAIAGAKMALISKSIREESRVISKRVRYLELANDPDFSEEFLNALYFPHRHIKRFPSVSTIIEWKNR